MKILKILLITILIVVLVVPTLGCGTESDKAGLSETQIVTVQRGDLTIYITAAGNLALSHTEDLAFDLFYQEGTVEEVLVEEAESVEVGQVLARLDTSEWEDQLTALEDKVVAAERNVTSKERVVTTAERKVTEAERQVAVKERDLLQAERNLIDAKIALVEAQDDLAQEPLQWVVNEAGHYALNREEVDRKELQVELAKGRLEDAKIALEDAKTKDIEDAKIALEDAKIAVEDAKKALEHAREDLDEAKNTSPEITAPFTGFITKVNVSGGDEVKKGTVVVTLADPNKFEADILVNEMDILQVKLGGEAQIQVDAMSGLTLPAKVTHISPTATIQSGVVNYKVKVEIESLQAARQGTSPGELPERIRQAIEEGRITQEQAEEMMEQMRESQGGQQGMPTMIPEDFQLREGLTVTVSILVDEASDVLMVPNSAITRQGAQSYVKVASVDGTIEERVIHTGISNWQYTEVTSGLSEGEQVVVSQGTTTTPTQQQGGRMPFFPGGGVHQ